MREGSWRRPPERERRGQRHHESRDQAFYVAIEKSVQTRDTG